MTEELLTVRPPNVIKQTITLSMGPCLVAGAIDIALKALYGENKNHVTKHELNPLRLYEDLDQSTRNHLEELMRASGSCLVEEWNLLAEETVEPMRTFFKVEKDCPPYWKNGETTRTRLNWQIEYRNRIWTAINETYDHKWGTFN